MTNKEMIIGGNLHNINNSKNDLWVLKIITCVLSCLPTIAILFSPFISVSNKLLTKSISLNGLNILSSISSGKLLYTTSSGAVLDFFIPKFLVYIIFTTVIISIVSSIITIFLDGKRYLSGFVSLIGSVMLTG